MEEGGWYPCFVRPFNDWEMKSVEDFIRVMRDKRINPIEKDKLVWNFTKDGLYTVKSSIDVLEDGRGVDSFPKKFVWNQLVPTKVVFFFFWFGKLGRVK